MLERPSGPTLEELRPFARTWKVDGGGLKGGEQVYAVPIAGKVGFYDVYDSRGQWCGGQFSAADRLCPTLEELRPFARTWKVDGGGLKGGEQVYAVPTAGKVGFYDVYNSRGQWCGGQFEAARLV